MRRFLINGHYRHAEAVLLTAIAFFISYYYGWGRHILEIAKAGAAVISALGVAAYNLRNRVVDFTLRFYKELPTSTDILFSENAKDCCRRLTDIVCLSFCVAITLLISTILSNQAWLACISGGAFFGCIVYHIHIMFAYDAVEAAVIDLAEIQATTKTSEKIAELVEAGKREHPDN